MKFHRLEQRLFHRCFETNKDITVSQVTINKLKEVKILNETYNNNFVSLFMEKKLSKSIISTLPKADTNDLAFSQYIQFYGINMQMKIINPKTSFIVENKENNIPDFI